jgi:ERCC4-type nuclease
MSLASVIIDQREPTPIQRLPFGGAVISISLLEYGDLLAIADDGTLLCVERKTPDDLLGSIRDNRLWTQLAGISQITRWAYLLITGELRRGTDGYVQTDGRTTGWSWAAVQGALLQAQEMGVFVVQAACELDYEDAVLRLAARSHREEMLVAPARCPRVLSEAEQILCALPGIGPERVQPILEYTSSPAWALSWLTQLEAQERVPGIGDGTKKSIRRVLGLADEEELSVIYKNGQIKEK